MKVRKNAKKQNQQSVETVEREREREREREYLF